MKMATRLIETGSIDIEAIKDQHPLDSIVSKFVNLKRRSGMLEALCPFHEERSASFKIYEKDNRYHCFGCGAHGDVFDFLEAHEGMDLRAAAEYITGGHYPTYTADRIEELRAKRTAFEAQEAAKRDTAIVAARERWLGADPNFETHAYLERKGIKAHGARLEGEMLLVPLIGPDGKPQTLQSIAPDGRKLFVSDAPVSAGLFVIGGKVVSSTGPVLLCEGFATGASLHEATGLVVVCAFNAGNMVKVAERLATTYPGKTYIVAGDDDRGKDRNVGREKAIEAAAILGAQVSFPDLPEGEGSDFNDMALAYGPEAVRALVIDGELRSGEAAEDPNIYATLSLDELEDLPPPTYLIDGILPEHGLTFVYGDPGAGKSFIAIDMALRIAFGMDWHGAPAKQTGVLYIAGEGKHGLGKRVKGWRKEHGLEGADAPFKLLPVAVHMLDKPSVDKLKRTITAVCAEVGFDVGLTIIDTVSRAIPGQDENKQDVMSLFVDGCADLNNFTNGAVIGVHHAGKDKDKGMRGSTVLLGGCEASIRVSKDEQTVTLNVEKQKDDEEADPIYMQMKKVEWASGLDKPHSTLVPERSNPPTTIKQTISKRQADEIFGVIADAWSRNNPWSVYPQAKRRGRYLPDYIATTYSITEALAVSYLSDWQANNYLTIEATAVKANAPTGLRVVKYLEAN